MNVTELMEALKRLPAGAPVHLAMGGDRVRPLERVDESRVVQHGSPDHRWWGERVGQPNAVVLRPHVG